MMKKRAWFSMVMFSLGWMLLTQNTSAGQNIQSREAIREAARSFAEQLADEHGPDSNTRILVGSLDSRLRLAKCSQPLEAFASPNTRNHGRTTVGVRCRGDKSWKLYISVDIQVLREVVTLKQSVSRNQLLSASDLQLTEKDVAKLHRGFYSSVEQLQGKIVRNPLAANAVITPAHVKNPLAVKKGNLVTILADTGGIQVRMKGKAMQSGSAGDWIPVVNISSERRIEGKIIGDGLIKVSL